MLEELIDDDLLLLDKQRAFEEADSDAEEWDNVQVKEFEDIFRVLKKSWSNVDKAFCVYQHMYEDLKKEKTVQSVLLKYFKRQ
jgi:hypothetical protein